MPLPESRSRTVAQAALVFTGTIPFAASGGILALLVRMHPSMRSGVGFIAVLGVAVLNGVVMVAFFNEYRRGGASATVAVREGVVAGSILC